MATIATPAAKALRPVSYRHLDADDPEPWALALIRLHGNGFLDPAIIEALNNLSPGAIRRLDEAETWDWRSVEDACVPESGGQPFTRRQIVYYRDRLGLRGHRGRVQDVGSQRNLIDAKDAEYQRLQGWGYLLPGYDENREAFIPGCTLHRRECDILSTLRDTGPRTRPELALALGEVKNLHTNGLAYLKRLTGLGLINRQHTGRLTYHLAMIAKRVDSWLRWHLLCRGE